jgi:hypothetical protein
MYNINKTKLPIQYKEKKMERKIRETVSNFCLQKPSNTSMPSYLNELQTNDVSFYRFT